MTAIDITRARAIPGWMSRRELRWLAEHAVSAPLVFEVGVSRGRSTRALGDHTPGTVYSVDVWEEMPGVSIPTGARAKALAEANLADLIQAGRVVLTQGDSVAVAQEQFSAMRGQADLVFIDGDHSYDGVKRDMEAYTPLLKPGGILAGHDYNTVPRHAGVRQAVDAVVPSVRVAGSIWWTQV